MIHLVFERSNMIFEELKKAKMEALKAKDQDAKNIASVMINKCMLLSITKKEKGEELTDADVISLMMKTLKELDDEEAGYREVNNQERVTSIERQKAFLQNYLPKMLSEEEIKKEILSLEDKSIPSVMKHFKTNFAGKVDMGLVNKVLRSLN